MSLALSVFQTYAPLLLLLAGLVSSGTILQYSDEDKGIAHVLSGEPGSQVHLHSSPLIGNIFPHIMYK